MQKFILVVILISVVSLKLYAEETLFNVSTLNQYNLKNNLIVTFDYNQKRDKTLSKMLKTNMDLIYWNLL